MTLSVSGYGHPPLGLTGGASRHASGRHPGLAPSPLLALSLRYNMMAPVAPVPSSVGSGMSLDARPEYSPTEALRHFERLWREELSAVTLAGELMVPHADAAEILRLLVRRDRVEPRLMERYPACVVVALSSCARRVYRGGALWDGLFEVLAQKRGQTLESRLGNAFVDALDSLEMPNPGDSHFRFVEPMALHACIPDHCVKDLLEKILARQEASPGLDGASFLSWANGLGSSSRVADLDKPVRAFLGHGQDYAIDLIDRTIDMLDLLRTGERNIEALVSGSGVPERFVTRALDLVAERELILRPISGTGQRPASMAPQLPKLALDLDRWNVVLRLPPVGEVPDGRAWWNITLDGEARRVDSRAGSGRALSHSSTEVIVDKPVRSVGVALGTSEHRYDLDLIDADAPLLAFDGQGAFLPMGTPLPDSEIWLLHPHSQGPRDDSVSFLGTGDVRSTAIGPVGWHGWSLMEVSLRGARAVEVDGHSRPVRRTARASLDAGSPVRWLRSRGVGDIHTQRPLIDVPMAAVSHEWTIEVRDGLRGTTIESHAWVIPAIDEDDDSDIAVVDPFEDWSSPLVGSFEIHARGPLGTRGNWRVTVCEGLRVVPSVECRSFLPGGLTPVSVRLDSAVGLQCAHPVMDLTSAELSATTTVTGPSGSVVIEVTPPHLEICHSSAGGSTEWTAGPLTLPSDGSTELGMLEVRMPTETALPPLLLHTPGGMTQTLVAHRGGSLGLQRFEMSRLTDTVKNHKSAELRWDFGGESTTLVRFLPKQLASSVGLERGRLVAQDFAGISTVMAGVYFILAPWRDPVIVALDEHGVGDCPDELVDAGPLDVELRIDDPWVPAPWDKWLGRGHRIFQTGVPQSDDVAELNVIRYLAFDERIPFDVGSLPYLWACVDVDNRLRQAGINADVRRDVARVFKSQWTAALRALLSTRIPPARALRQAIVMGLVEQRLHLSESEAQALWQLHPALAALGAHSPGTSADAVVSRCGVTATSLLKGREDPHPSCGRFESSIQMNLLDKPTLEQMIKEGGIVPAALLDRDTRAQAAFELFLVRHNRELFATASYSKQAVTRATKVIRDAGYARLADAIDDRPEPNIHHSWQLLPQLSLLMAALARVGSRKQPVALRALDEMRAGWEALARMAPRYVEMDVVLAELLAISEDRARAANEEEDACDS